MFYDKVGKMALGSRMRMLSERLTEDAHQIYDMYQVDLKPKWFPVFYVLANYGPKSVTAIAEEIGHSHPSVSKIVREMVKEGIAIEKKDSNDGRKNIIELTEKGQSNAGRLTVQCNDIDHAVEGIYGQMRHNIWYALQELEYLLDQKSLLDRVRVEKKQRAMQQVSIVPYTADYSQAFHDLNEAWISRYFTMEEADRKALCNPEGYIINNGGHIFVALHQGQPVGVCALIKMDDPEYDYELAKMAVSDQAQGLGIGWLLGKKIVDKARELGANKIYLESNAVLKPAINLYQKLGFSKVPGRATPYARCNIQMELQVAAPAAHNQQ